MITELVLFMGTATPTPPAPTFTAGPSVAHTAGGCTTPVTPATRTVSWTLNFPSHDPADFGVKVYRNGVLISTISSIGASGSYTDTRTGLVEEGPVNTFSETVTYRIDVYRQSNGSVAVSASAAPFTMTYGECSGGGGL